MADDDWKSAEDLLRTWLQRTRDSQHSHHEAGKLCKRLNYLLAVPIIVISTSLGTAAFATLSSDITGMAKTWFGAFSMTAAVLAGLQTHLRYAERGEKHKNLGAQYGNIRRNIEEILILPVNQRGPQKRVLDTVRSDLDAISAEGDVVSRRIFEKTKRRLAEKDSRRQDAGNLTRPRSGSSE